MKSDLIDVANLYVFLVLSEMFYNSYGIHSNVFLKSFDSHLVKRTTRLSFKLNRFFAHFLSSCCSDAKVSVERPWQRKDYAASMANYRRKMRQGSQRNLKNTLERVKS